MLRLQYRSAVASALGLDPMECVASVAVETRACAVGSSDCSYSELAKSARYLRAILDSWEKSVDDGFDEYVRSLVVLALANALKTLKDCGELHLFTSLLEQSCH